MYSACCKCCINKQEDPSRSSLIVGPKLQVEVGLTCSQRRAPLRSGWLSWQRCRFCDPRSPSSLQTAEGQRLKPETVWKHVSNSHYQPVPLTLCIAVGVDRMVGEANFVSFPRGINHKICREETLKLQLRWTSGCSVSHLTVVEVEEEAAHVFVVDLPSAVCFVLGDDLQTGVRGQPAGKTRVVLKNMKKADFYDQDFAGVTFFSSTLNQTMDY